MKARIEQVMAAEGLTPARFAERIGVQRSAISHILSGRNNPSFDMIQAILREFPRISPDWLVMGNGAMYRALVQRSLFDALPPEPPRPPAAPPPAPPAPPAPPPLAPPKPVERGLSAPEVERVIIFYTDRTFGEYRPARD